MITKSKKRYFVKKINLKTCDAQDLEDWFQKCGESTGDGYLHDIIKYEETALLVFVLPRPRRRRITTVAKKKPVKK
jgi:hypothetical protein